MANVIQLKGGSLNSTCLHITEQGKFVRKSINTDQDREYGYVRWYSQLKKLQRFNQLFPNLTPRVIDVGVIDNAAYFDIEYIEDGKDIKTLFVEDQLTAEQITNLNTALWSAFDTIHSHKYAPNKNSLRLYFKEEVEQKLNDARKFPEFEIFYQINSYEYQGHIIPGMRTMFDTFSKMFDTTIDTESYVHGNPTLENIMYSPSTSKITFIDLYEEGIIDSQFMDYSQVLQCSNSFYGVYNDNEKQVIGNVVASNATIPSGLKLFNSIFEKELASKYPEKYNLIKLFEATQFFRMLPFKCHAGDFVAAKFFYAHACFLVSQLCRGQ